MVRFITGATGQLHLYPRDVKSIFIPVVPEHTQQRFRELANLEYHAFQHSRALLAAGTRAVEIAIEDGEAAALAFLKQVRDVGNAATA